MKKKPASKTTDIEEVEKTLLAISAKRQFLGASVSMGWQLAITILVPVFIGTQLDNRFDTSPSYTLAALFLAIGMSIVVIARTINQVKKDQAKQGNKRAK